MRLRSWSTWLCLRLCRSAEGATSGSEVRKTAVPGARDGCDFFSIAISWSRLTLALWAFCWTIAVPRTQVHIISADDRRR